MESLAVYMKFDGEVKYDRMRRGEKKAAAREDFLNSGGGSKSRLKAGCGQNCPPHELRRLLG